MTMKRAQFSRTVLLSSLLPITAALAGCCMDEVKKPAPDNPSAACVYPTEQQIADLFKRWNDSLQTGDAHKVVANYATRSILLPTVSNKPRLTPEEKLDYFEHFLQNKPSGTIDLRFFVPGCNSAVDAGLYTFYMAASGKTVHARYTFTYALDHGQWLITSHHSSAMPETEGGGGH
jgi:uncharacterized protein (TIGR02246 family)